MSKSDFLIDKKHDLYQYLIRMVERLVYFIVIRNGLLEMPPPEKIIFEEGTSYDDCFKLIHEVERRLKFELNVPLTLFYITDVDGNHLFSNDDFDCDLGKQMEESKRSCGNIVQ